MEKMAGFDPAPVKPAGKLQNDRSVPEIPGHHGPGWLFCYPALIVPLQLVDRIRAGGITKHLIACPGLGRVLW